VGTVGKAESAYLAGVRVPSVTSGGVAERAGIRAGDVVLRVGDYLIKAAPDQVRARRRGCRWAVCDGAGLRVGLASPG